MLIGMDRMRYAVNFGGLLALYSVALAVTSPAASAGSASFPIYVPQECFELAQREGVPTVILNKFQATKARLILARLKTSDTLVVACRAAVKRAEMNAKEQATLAREASAH